MNKMQQLCTLCGEAIETEEYLVVTTTIMPDQQGIVNYQHLDCAKEFGKDVEEMF